MVVFDKDKDYMEVLRACRDLISRDYKTGGWFPPVREMSKRFNISPVTFVKVTKLLVIEGVAESHQRKGIYIVPEWLRVKKVGLVVNDGNDSPFLIDPYVAASIVQRLKDKGFDIHIIQGSSLINIARSAVSHWVSGLIWLRPPAEAIQLQVDMVQNKLLPYLAVNPEGGLPENVPRIERDQFASFSDKVDFLISRGHRKIGFIGLMTEARKYGLDDIMQSRGIDFDESYCSGFGAAMPDKIVKLISENNISALIVEGGPTKHEAVFRTLSNLPEENRPEVIAWSALLEQIMQRYPGVKVIGYGADYDDDQLGVAAVDLLVDNLDSPEMIMSTKVKTYSIHPLDQ